MPAPAEAAPTRWRVVVGDRGDGRGVTHEREHGLAVVAHVAIGQHGLVLARRVDPEPVVPRDVGGAQDPDQARVAGEDGGKVADAEPGVGVR